MEIQARIERHHYIKARDAQNTPHLLSSRVDRLDVPHVDPRITGEIPATLTGKSQGDVSLKVLSGDTLLLSDDDNDSDYNPNAKSPKKRMSLGGNCTRPYSLNVP